MRIAFLTNEVRGGWHPDDLDTFLGGNEECLLLLARALARAGHHVEVHTSIRRGVMNGINTGPYIDDDGVLWLDREHYRRDCDVFISWKDRAVWAHPVNARVKIHASQDVEAPLSLDQIDYVTVLGTYHAERMPWLHGTGKRRIVPLGIDTAMYRPRPHAPESAQQREDIALYATSPDRGLMTLLEDWPKIRAHHPDMDLLVTYDWSRLETMSGVHGATFAKHLELWCDQDGVSRVTCTADGMRDLFRRARYYIHPLPRPDADLFGFGAMKAQACGCTLVLPDTLDNGFRDMARAWIPYSRFVQGETAPQVNPRYCQGPESWDEIVAKYWAPLLEGR